MRLEDDLFGVIPIGEDNAVTSQHKLNELAAAGLIERKRVMINARPTSLYFRPSNPSVGL